MSDEQPTNPPAIGESSLDDFWTKTEIYLSNEERGDAGPRESLKKSAATLFGIDDPANVYVAKATQAGYRNQVWQGQAISRSNDVMILVDKTGNEDGIADAARSRLHPLEENGFESIVIVEPDALEWKIQGVVEYEHASLAEEIRKSCSEIEVRRIPDPASRNPPASTEEAAHAVSGSTPDLAAHLQEARNIILGGPPGTSKTHSAFQIVEHLAGGDPEGCRLESILKGREWHQVPVAELQEPALVWEFIQLHPSYTYEDFVRGLRTDPEGTGFSLVSVDGILPIISHIAAVRRGKPTILVIDELNRCNLPAVFGETIFAIDPAQRGRPIRLQYEGSSPLTDTLRVPPELLVIGTMNTADRSISALDFAVRRRFRFLFLGPSEERLKEYYGSTSLRAKATVQFLQAFNSIVPDHEIQIGHAYLMIGRSLSAANWRKELAHKIVFEVCPLLREYREEERLVGADTLSLAGLPIDLHMNEQSLLKLLEEAIAVVVPDEKE